MNKIKQISLSVATLCAIVFVSCSSNEFDMRPSVATSEEHSELLSQMAYFNDSILAAKRQTRSFVQPGAWRRAQIIAADCGGAYSGGRAGAWAGSFLGPNGTIAGGFLGGLLGGACGSYVAWKSTRNGTRTVSTAPVDIALAKEKTINAYVTMLNEDNTLSDYAPQKINVLYPVVNENVTLMGAKHNIILKKLVEGENMAIDGTQQLSKEQVDIINSKDFSESFNNTMKSICNNISTSEGMSLEGEGISTKLMNMFYDILIKYPDGLGDIEFLINKYMDAVKNSPEIPEDDKPLIYSGLSVAASSSEFWSENF